MVIRYTGAFHFTLPVGIRSEIVRRLHRETIVVHESAVLVAVHHIVAVGNIVYGYITVVGDVGLPGFAPAGRHDDDAVGGFRSVDGCCRSVAEHIDAFDVVWRYEAEGGSGYAINDVIGLHRGSATSGGCTAQTDGWIGIGVTVIGRDG